MKKLLNTRQKKLSALMRSFSLPKLTANENITKLTQYELSQEETDLLEAGLYFSIQPDNLHYFHCSLINNLKYEETKSQIKAHLSCIC